MNKHIKILFISAVLAITGCSSSNDPVEKAKIANKQNQNFSTAQDAINLLSDRLKTASEHNLVYFAPKLVKQAKENLAEAKDEFNDFLTDITDATDSATKDIIEEVSEANTALDKADAIKRNAEMILGENFDIIAVLQELQVTRFKDEAKEFRKLKEDVDELVEDIADGDLEDAKKDNAKLLPKLRQLEVDVVSRIHLTTPKNELNALRKARANTKQPVTYQDAVSSVTKASSVIAANPRDKEAISTAVDAVKFAIQRAQNMRNGVITLDKLASKKRESYLLQFEKAFHKIAQATGENDFRNKTFPAQATAIAEEISKLIAAQAELAAQLEQAKLNATSAVSQSSEQVTALQNENATLAQTIKTKDAEVAQKAAELKSALTQLSDSQIKLAQVTQELSALQLQLVEKEKQALAESQNSIENSEDNGQETAEGTPATPVEAASDDSSTGNSSANDDAETSDDQGAEEPPVTGNSDDTNSEDGNA